MEFESDQPPRYLEGAPLNADDEVEEEWELDEELAAQGLYRGSYKRLMALYTLVPLTSTVSFIFMALLPTFAYPLDRASPRSPYPYVPYLPFPLPELLTSIAFWSLSHLLRDPLFVISSFISRPFRASVYVTTTLSTTFQTITSLFFSLIIIPILLIPHYNLAHHPTWEDTSFRRVWWVALGWAAAEAVVGVKQGYEGIGLYRDVLVTVRRSNGDLRKTSNATVKLDSAATVRPRSGSGNGSPNTLAPGPSSISRQASREVEPQTVAEGERQPLLTRKPTNEQQDFLIQTALELEVERDLEQLIALKNREELEEVYGMPFIDIPVFLSCLHRVNSILSSLGLFLLLSAAYMRSRFADFPLTPIPGGMRTSSWIPGLHDALEGGRSNTYLIITLPVVLALQLLLAFLHTPLILPRIGVQSFVYVNLLVSLGMFFAGLGIWEALS
ncbi:hypothetical protein BDQ12DRAFT_686712 [Crucibulum laeve]|uniref:Uncharacterized protein n=1 Tax=Crucibulum laeve TaxID=68775 RepID=A0A5C3LWV7_9AGAR|nr:hypothetical protein BDQ12DRAFT_686712 [Crucibulum laeve]